MLIPPNGKSKTVKDQIIQILSRQWPLSAKKIHNKIKKNKQVSYQAVHKSLKQLLKENVVERTKDSKNYKINRKWVEQLHKYVTRLEANLREDTVPFCAYEKKDKKELRNIKFNSVEELDHFTLTLLKDREKKTATTMSKHFWWSGTHFKEDKKPEINPENVYSICKGDTFFDKIATEHEKGINFNSSMGRDFVTNFDVFVVDNKIFFLFYPNEFFEKLEDLYKNNKNVLDKKYLKTLNELIKEEREINVVSFKNKKLAAELRNEIKGEVEYDVK